MTEIRRYRETTRYVYATVTSAADPSAGDVWMAVVAQGVPAATSNLRAAEWVPGETWTDGQRRARLLIGPESVFGALTAGPYKVYSKTDLGAEVPFEPEDYWLVITSESSPAPSAPVTLAAVAYTGQYADLIGEPESGGVPTSRQVIAGTGLTGGGDLTVNRTIAVQFGCDRKEATPKGGTRWTPSSRSSGSSPRFFSSPANSATWASSDRKCWASDACAESPNQDPSTAITAGGTCTHG